MSDAIALVDKVRKNAELRDNMRVVVDTITRRHAAAFSKADIKIMWDTALADFDNAAQWFRSEAERLVPERGINRRILETKEVRNAPTETR